MAAMQHGTAFDVVIVSESETDVTRILPGVRGSLRRSEVLTPDDLAVLRPTPSCIVLDCRTRPHRALDVVARLRAQVAASAILVVLEEDDLSAIDDAWAIDDVLLRTASPAEVSARLRLRVAAGGRVAQPPVGSIRHGPLHIERSTHSVLLDGRELTLTFREFELLAYLASRPGRVCGRPELLRVVWGKDSMEGARTIDVHVARLRRKLGPRHGALLETVRSVGYRLRFGPQAAESAA